MCIVPKFIIDWFMIMVLLVLKLFVSSHPLKLEGVLCIYVLLLHEGQAEIHFDMFFHMVETHTWLSLFHFSWSLICVLFHVITWLLSFFYRDYIFHAHVLHHLLCVLFTLRGIFMRFLKLTYWQDATVPVPYFRFCVSEKLHRKYSRNWTKQK
jgi:hypothetical protein